MPLLLLCWLVFGALSPVCLPLAVLVDGVRRVKFATVRVYLFLWLYLSCEVAGVLLSAGVWLLRLPLGPERYRAAHFALQRWWAGALWWGARSFFSLELQVTGEGLVSQGPYILLLRHSSMADTLLASAFIGVPHRLRLRYVLKEELLWDPCLDIVGLRIPNAFISRNKEDNEGSLEELRLLVRDVGADEGVLIYPEGTRFTRSKRERLLERFAEKGERELLHKAQQLQRVLPPRPKGTLALLQERPDLDVVICVHSGFETVTSFWHLWRGAPIGEPIFVEFWRIPAAEIPKSEAQQSEWLFELWKQVDEWVIEKERTGS